MGKRLRDKKSQHDLILPPPGKLEASQQRRKRKKGVPNISIRSFDFNIYNVKFSGNEFLFIAHLSIDGLFERKRDSYPCEENATILTRPDPRRGIHRKIYLESKKLSLQEYLLYSVVDECNEQRISVIKAP